MTIMCMVSFLAHTNSDHQLFCCIRMQSTKHIVENMIVALLEREQQGGVLIKN